MVENGTKIGESGIPDESVNLKFQRRRQHFSRLLKNKKSTFDRNSYIASVECLERLHSILSKTMVKFLRWDSRSNYCAETLRTITETQEAINLAKKDSEKIILESTEKFHQII